MIGIIVGFFFELVILLVLGIKDSIGKSIVVGDGKWKKERARVVEKVLNERFWKVMN